MTEAQRVEIQPLQRQERKEQPPLLARDHAHETAGCCGVSLEEGDRVDLDVGVLADTVRVGVVARVLGVPPRVAHADDAAEHSSEPVVGGPAGEDLAVRCLVGEERDLSEQDAERGSHQKLKPAVAQNDESGDRAAEARGDRGANCRIEPRRAPEQAEFTDHLRHLRVGTGHRRELSGPRVGLANRPESGRLVHGGTGRYRG